MKRKSLLKLSVVIGLSIMLVLTFAKFTLAADFDWENATVTTENTAGNTPTNTETNTAGNNVVNPTGNVVDNSVYPTSNNVVTNNTTNTANTVNTTNTSNEAMPYTGIEDTNTIVALIAVTGVVVAIYSYRKIKEYKNV